jgi:hypothetical protein
MCRPAAPSGYQHPDLTAHGAQILEWYAGEDGLDLHALDADCALLRAAAAAADQALRQARDGHAVVSAEWQGESGSAAVDFIERHCAAAAVVAGALDAAAEACEVLRDGLGRLVDEKVGAAVSIDDRRAGERPAWLAGAAAVTGGGAARNEAVDVVTQQITPYVDADIRTDWLTAMRSATASVAAAYQDAVRQLNTVPAAYFEVPGQLGALPVVPQVAASAAPQAGPAVQTVPAAPPPPLAGYPAPAPPAPDIAAAQPLPPQSLAEPQARPGFDSAAAPGIPGMPDVGGDRSGLVGRIADALGGLFNGMPDTPVAEDPPALDPLTEQDPDQPEPAAESTEEAVPEEVPVVDDTTDGAALPVDEPTVAAAECPEVGSAPPPPPPEPVPEPAPDPPPPAEQPEEQTPCEIAADELAQVGQ